MSDTKTETVGLDPTPASPKDQTINNETTETPTVADPDKKDADSLTEEKTSTNNLGKVKSEIKSLSETKAQAKILRLSRNIEVHEDKSRNVKFDPSTLEDSSDPTEIRKQVSVSKLLI